jgi:hypothetical protein
MRTSETFKEINHAHCRYFGGVASTVDLSASRRQAKGAACAAEEDGEDGLPVPPSEARPGAEGDPVVMEFAQACGAKNHVDLRGLPGGAEGIRTDGHRTMLNVRSEPAAKHVAPSGPFTSIPAFRR